MTHQKSTHARPSGGVLLAVLLALASVLLFLTGCTKAPVSASQLDAYAQIQASCPGPLAVTDEKDTTGSRDTSFAGQDRQAVKDDILRTALCSGSYRLELFTSSEAASAVVVDEQLQLPGATKTAQARRAPAVVASVMRQIDKGYQKALLQVQNAGPSTDVLSRLEAGAEYLQQVNATRDTGTKPYKLRMTVLTDGIDERTGQTMTTAQAKQLADTVPVPKLPGAQLAFVGIGREAGTAQPSTAFTDGLVAFYTELGRRTGAAHTTVVTSYAGLGGEN